MKQNELNWTQWLERAKSLGKKYKYALLILALGIGLMLIPEKQEAGVMEVSPKTDEQRDLEQELEVLLSQVEGAGEVRVLLSWDTGLSYEYQMDVEQKKTADGTEETRTTVLTTSDDGESAVAVRTIYPICKGAVVVCQGADRAAVKLAIVQAVASITGLGSDRITVIKMKSGN